MPRECTQCQQRRRRKRRDQESRRASTRAKTKRSTDLTTCRRRRLRRLVPRVTNVMRLALVFTRSNPKEMKREPQKTISIFPILETKVQQKKRESSLRVEYPKRISKMMKGRVRKRRDKFQRKKRRLPTFHRPWRRMLRLVET
jgi:hypothetical protein